MSEVSILKCSEYEETIVEETLEKIIENTDFPEVFHKKVLIKPNILSDSRPEKAITTHPECIRALIRILKKRGADEIMSETPLLFRKVISNRSIPV